jgi:hypothetical protein
MKHRIHLRPGPIRKWNGYLDNWANSVDSPTLKSMITSRKIHVRGVGQLVQKGH